MRPQIQIQIQPECAPEERVWSAKEVQMRDLQPRFRPQEQPQVSRHVSSSNRRRPVGGRHLPGLPVILELERFEAASFGCKPELPTDVPKK